MGAALVLLLVGLGALAAGVLIGRYYVPDDRQLRRAARHSRAYMRALSHLITRDHEAVVKELSAVVEDNVDDVEPYFALGALFRSRGERVRAIRVHQALAQREHDKRDLHVRALYELGLDFRAAAMPRRATRAMEEVLVEDPGHDGALRVLAALYEEQARFGDAADLLSRLVRRVTDRQATDKVSLREHHLLVAAAQTALGHNDRDTARQLLKRARTLKETPHFYAAAAELAAAADNPRGAFERLKQAVKEEPGILAQLMPNVTATAAQLAHAHALPAAGDSIALPAAPADELAAPETASHAPVTVEPPDELDTAPAPAEAADAATHVLQFLAEVEGDHPRLEVSLIRAQLATAADPSTRVEVAAELAARFPDALAARVAAGRLALDADRDTERCDAIRGALDALVGPTGPLDWALRGRWQCSACGYRPEAGFSWRCGRCRQWGTLRMETGIEPPLLVRERRIEPRLSALRFPSVSPEALLGAPPEAAPFARVPQDLAQDDLAGAVVRRSILDRMGGWIARLGKRTP